MDEYFVVFLISNYHSKDHFDHHNTFEKHPEYADYAKIPTRRWQEATPWIRACCYYDAADKAFDIRGKKPDEFIERIMTVRRKSDFKAIHNIHYLQPVQLYFPEGSYCQEHIKYVETENASLLEAQG